MAARGDADRGRLETAKGAPEGLHGTNLVSVEALPNGAGGSPQVLNEGTLDTVTTSSSLVFRVTIHDGGDFQEVQIPVQLTIGRPQSEGGPITRTATVQVIDPGQNASVTFGDLPQVTLATQTTCSRSTSRACRARRTSRTTPARVQRHLLAAAGLDAVVHVSGTAAAVVALVSVALALSALAVAATAIVRLGRLRAAQRTTVGGGRTRADLVYYTVGLLGRIDDHPGAVDEIAAGLARVDRRVGDSLANSAIVRYDAYEDTGGHQSASLALLDGGRTGVVVTAIQGRDYARIYMKGDRSTASRRSRSRRRSRRPSSGRWAAERAAAAARQASPRRRSEAGTIIHI